MRPNSEPSKIILMFVGGDFINTLDKIGDAALVDGVINKTLEEFYDDVVTTIGYGVFATNRKLKVVNCPNARIVDPTAFSQASALEAVSLPKVENINDYAFQFTDSLRYLSFPALKSLGVNALRRCQTIERMDLGLVTTVSNASLAECGSLTAVVLRSITICVCGTSVFTGCYHFYGTKNSTYNPTGAKDGYFYVPRALLSDTDATMDYRRATNWSEHASQFRALEDYTVDGTITGELDESKV